MIQVVLAKALLIASSVEKAYLRRFERTDLLLYSFFVMIETLSILRFTEKSFEVKNIMSVRGGR